MFNRFCQKIKKKIGPLSKSIAKVFSVKVVIYIVSFFSSVYIARTLGPTEKGHYALFQTIVMFIVQFEFFGMSSAITYYVSKNSNDIDKCYGSIIFISFCSFLLNSLLFLIFYLFKINFGLTAISLFMSFFCGTFSLFTMLMSNFFIAQNKLGLFNISELLSCSLLFIFAFLFKSFYHTLNSSSMIILYTTNILIIFLIQVFFSKSIKPYFDFSYLKMLFKYGLKSYLACLAVSLVLKVDIFMLNSMVSADDIGIYSLAVNLSDLFYTVSSSVILIVFPKFASLENIKDKILYMNKLLKGMFFITIPILLIFGILAPLFITIFYGEAYAESADVLRILLPGVFFWTYFNYFSIFFASENKFLHTIWIPVLATLLNIGLNLYLIPRISIQGAAISSSITYFIGCTILAFFFFKNYNTKKCVETV